MKQYHIITGLLLLLLAGSCTTDSEMIIDLPFNDEIVFNVAIPEEVEVSTRGIPIPENRIENMYVLVFDQNGYFLSRTQAERGSGTGNYKVSLLPTDQDLPAGKRKRIVHFICNYDWSEFSDIPNLGKHENELIAPLSISGNNVAYWQRVELQNGITKNAFTSTIELLCNVAKISVNNNTLFGSGLYPPLLDADFAIGSYLDHGTVAPFNTSTMLFEEGSAVESPYGNIRPVRESDFVEAGSGGYWGVPTYCFEQKNSVSRNPLYIIIKGKYPPSQTYSYYKIDIVDSGEEILHDIIRNCHYKVNIREIKGPGNATLQEAINSPASNNLIYSIVLEDYTSVSDGVAALNVETTTKTMVMADTEYRIGFSYFPFIGGTENNTNVNVVLEQSSVGSEQVLSSFQVVRTAGSAYILMRTKSELPPYNINSARLIISTIRDGVILRRVVKLRLRAPILFEKLTISPNPIPTLGSEVEVTFTIPNTIKAQLYPFSVYITSKNLTPNVDNEEKNDNLTLDYQIPGRYRYAYTVNGPGKHTAHFKTSNKGFSEKVIIESELFQTMEYNISAL